MELKGTLKGIAQENLMDYFAVAPGERMMNAPAGSRPQDILPTVKSIISMGIKIRSGVRAANKRAYEGVKMAIAVYMHFGHQFLNDKLDHASYLIYRKLVDEGYQSMPMPAAHPYPYITEVIFEGKGANLFSNRHAAVAAGIGEFGWNSLLITPEAGPRVRFVTVLTEAEIEPDSMYNGKPICERDKCPDPMICARICPLQAIDSKNGVDLNMNGKTFTYGRVDKTKCIWGILGLRKATLGKIDCSMPEKRDVNSLYKALMEEDPMERQERFGNGHMCGKCIIHCPIGQSNS